MRPVNLLPPELRPRERRREGRGPAHVVLGVLAALLVLVVVYALSANQVNSKKTDIARAKSDIEAAKSQVAASDAFGDFHSVKQTREASVKQLASDRFDWERLMRELALVLPDKTWLLDATASSSGDASAAAGPGGAVGATGAAGASATPTGTADASASSPSLDLKGCALHQNDVAVMLVRLRKMNRVDSVDLKDSTQETTDTGGAPSEGGNADDSDNCGKGRFKFEVAVTFTQSAAGEKPAGDKVPARLGGGS